MYLAGLLLATGASLAMAVPASAAPGHHRHHHCDQDGRWSDSDSWLSNDLYNGSSNNGIVLFSGNNSVRNSSTSFPLLPFL
jgi:hypothetical protein